MFKTLSVISFVSIIILTVMFFVKQAGVIKIEQIQTNLEYKGTTISFWLICLIDFLIPLVFLLPVFTYRPQYLMLKNALYLLGAYTSLLLSLALSETLKFFVYKERPNYLSRMAEVVLLENNNQISEAKHMKADSTKSFPSGHTSSIFSLVLVIPYVYSREGLNVLFTLGSFIVLIVSSGLVAFSRINDHDHDLADIGWGIDVGILCSVIVLYILEMKVRVFYLYEEEKIEDDKENNET